MMVHACNPSTQKAERIEILRLAWALYKSLSQYSTVQYSEIK
jgi:hypothetical protein